jgi:hypothetical protein
MKFLCQPRILRSEPVLVSGSALLVLLFAVGCASPGPPHPPSLKLPVIVDDLSAERIGDQVVLHWTTPSKTTDKLDIKGPLTAEICRSVLSVPPPSTTTEPPCTPVTRIPVVPGPSHAADTLPRPLTLTRTLDPAVLLSYRIRILNTNNRSAGLSPPAFAAAGAAPPPVEELRATPVREGAILEWSKQPTPAAVVLDRLVDEAAPSAQPASAQAKTKTKTRAKNSPKPSSHPSSQPAAKPIQTPAQNPSQTAAKPAPHPSTPASPVEVRLQTASDSGGMIDRTAQLGVTYRYTAERIRTVTLDVPDVPPVPAGHDGHASPSSHTLQLHSAPSAPLIVLLRDTFPPATPTGLAAVPAGATPADASAQASAQASIDLSWKPDTDPDLAGYFIYRQQVSPTGQLIGVASRLNPNPSPAPGYRDHTAVAGQMYAYRVTAVDTAGNESAPSADVQEVRRDQ